MPGSLAYSWPCAEKRVRWPGGHRPHVATVVDKTRPKAFRLTTGAAVIRLSEVTWSGSDRAEGAHLIGARTDHASMRLWYLIPGSGEIAEWFGNHQPGLIAEPLEDLHVRMQLT